LCANELDRSGGTMFPIKSRTDLRKMSLPDQLGRFGALLFK
jgi:hypothetical protein